MNGALFGLAMAAPVLEPEPLDSVAACVEHAGPVSGSTPVVAGNRIALVVGVPCHDDPSIPSLQFSSRDATAVGERLRARGFAVHALTTRVSRRSFEDQLDAVGRALGADGELVIYFSGHGVLRETDSGLQRFLVFSDTDVGDVERTGLSLRMLEQRVQRIDAGRRVIIQDSCYASGEGSKGLGLPSGSKSLGLANPPLASVDTRLYASRFYELATEDLERAGSVYTSHLLDALDRGPDLDGDGCVGLLEAHLEAADQTVRQRDGYQHPEWAGSFTDDTCDGAAARGVVLDDGVVRAVEPGRMDGERVGAGDWVVLQKRQRLSVQVGSWAAVRHWQVSNASFGGELSLLWRAPVNVLLGVRGAWLLPSEVNGVRLRGGEGFARLGLLGDGRVQLGGVLEVGLAVLDPKGAQLPVQSTPALGSHGRAQVAFGPVYLALEAGVGVIAERRGGRVRPTWMPTVAGGLGVRL